jgi:hypothetical protein
LHGYSLQRPEYFIDKKEMMKIEGMIPPDLMKLMRWIVGQPQQATLSGNQILVCSIIPHTSLVSFFRRLFVNPVGDESMRFLAACFLAATSVTLATGADLRGFRFTTGDSFLPKMKAIVIVKAGDPGPGAAKHTPVASTIAYKEIVKVDSPGSLDVWWQPIGGKAIKVVAGATLKEGEVREIKIDDHVGVVTVRGDGQPRAGLITITAQDDPGPDERGHVPVQTAQDYRMDMVAPPGFYALWVSPDNGARPKKISDRFRIDAGKSITID